MSRGLGLTEWLAGLPESATVVFALVTQLGDFWFLASASVLTYLLGDHLPALGRDLTRRRAAMVLALLTTAAALTVALKVLFALPRPPGAGTVAPIPGLPDPLQALYTSMATGSGYGFPSGHATSTTLVWGGFAWALRVGTARKRWAVAAGAVALVSLSRLVLGVHYLVDVVAGVIVAATVLALAVRVLERPSLVFGLATALAVIGVVLGGLTHDTAGALGLTVGATAAWLAVDQDIAYTRHGTKAAAGGGLALLAVAGSVFIWMAPGPAVLAVVVGLMTAGVVALPLVGERGRKNRGR